MWMVAGRTGVVLFKYECITIVPFCVCLGMQVVSVCKQVSNNRLCLDVVLDAIQVSRFNQNQAMDCGPSFINTFADTHWRSAGQAERLPTVCYLTWLLVDSGNYVIMGRR